MAQRSSSRKPRSSGASRRGASKSSGAAPVWVWLVTGLFTGLFVAFLIFLSRVDTAPGKGERQQAKTPAEQAKLPKPAKPNENSPPKKEESAASEKPEPEQGKSKEPVKSAAAAKPQNAKPTEATAEKPALNYDFYKILPKSEVVVPEEEIRKPANSAANAPGTYYLQVGAFRRIEEADGRKAELAMLGIVSTIQTVTVDPGNSWHRVRIGPVKDMRQLDKAKRQLQENNISFVTLKENR